MTNAYFGCTVMSFKRTFPLVLCPIANWISVPEASYAISKPPRYTEHLRYPSEVCFEPWGYCSSKWPTIQYRSNIVTRIRRSAGWVPSGQKYREAYFTIGVCPSELLSTRSTTSALVLLMFNRFSNYTLEDFGKHSLTQIHCSSFYMSPCIMVICFPWR